MPVIFTTPRDMLGQAGRDLGVSDWLRIEQSRIDGFAEVTEDRQWIHVDPVRAAAGPFGGTIAHGYLTLSLVNHFLPQLLEVRGAAMGVNVGCNSIRFIAPVRAGARIRGAGRLESVEEIKGAIQCIVRVTVEIEGGEKPACVVDTISRFFEAASK